MDFKKTISFSIILVGATAMASQIVFLREFLVVFYGNEISIGIILGSWLLWGAFGSMLLGRFSDLTFSRVRVFSMCQLLLASILPITLLFIRLSRNIMGTTTGEIIGFPPMIIATVIIFCIPCVIMGFMFSLGCALYREVISDAKKSIANVYVMEAIGALSGGLLVSYFLVRYMTPFSIIFILFSFNILASGLMQRFGESYRFKKIVLSITICLLIGGISGMLFGGGGWIRKFSLDELWKGYNVLESKDTIYGNITVTEREDSHSFYENGLHLYTVPDRLSSEESVHFTLLENKNPQSVLLIGGGVGGLIDEILKHNVKRIDYVELDPTIIEMGKKYLDEKEIKSLAAPQVEIINEDGRFFVKRTKEKYDCIIINLGDPYTAQLNRFYTVDFFRELSRVLKKGGVVSFALTSSENYISDELASYLRSIYFSAKEVFPQVIIIPGDTAYFLATNSPGALTYDSDELMRRLKERGIETLYVRDYYLFDKLSEERVKYLKDVIRTDSTGEINTDFKPISYYYATVFWGTHFNISVMQKLMKVITSRNIWIAFSILCFIILLFGLITKKRRTKKMVLLAVMTTGFAEIIFQIAVMLSFQVIYGYVFYKLGIIITSFMVGLALGGWIMSKYMDRVKNDAKLFSWVQVSICLYPLILPLIFLWLSRSESWTVSWLGSNVIFPFLPIIAGVIGGIQFPLANKIYLEESCEIGRAAGLSYGLDLFGACIGSFLAAAFLIPVLGIVSTCFLVAMINGAVLVTLLADR